MIIMSEGKSDTAAATKRSRIAAMLEERIRRGDYVANGLPTEPELAAEAGVSRTTARLAMLDLVRKGLMVRKPHGKLELSDRHASVSGRLNVALLVPAWSSPYFEAWRHAIEHAAVQRNTFVRTVDFVHWDDPVIPRTLSNFDGVFLEPGTEPIPPTVMKIFSRTRHLVVLEEDLSGAGIPSVQLLPADFIQLLGEHLYGLGHRRIDCLNTQPASSRMARRLDQWRLWQKLRQVEGRIWDSPVEAYTHPTPHAYHVMKRLLKTGEFQATALVCLDDAVAIGAMRALREQALQPGQDVSVCAFDSAGLQRYQYISLTVLERPDAGSYLNMFFDWFAARTEPWSGPTRVQPATVDLFAGESTGPAPGVARDFTKKGTKATANARDPDSQPRAGEIGEHAKGDDSPQQARGSAAGGAPPAAATETRCRGENHGRKLTVAVATKLRREECEGRIRDPGGNGCSQVNSANILRDH